MNMTGKTAIITGAAHGIGRASAVRLAAEGGNVALFDVDYDGIEETATIIRAAGGTALPLKVDITQNEEIKDAVARVLAEYGQIDVLVNNAGAGWKNNSGPFKDSPEGSWQWILELNVTGTLQCTQAVLNHMVERRTGRIINVASIAAHTGLANLAVYATSKGAIISFTKSLAMELGPYNVTVNSISPGMVSPSLETPPCDGTFLGRKGSPVEMANMIAFLASDEAAFITGADHLVDGGRVLGPRGA